MRSGGESGNGAEAGDDDEADGEWLGPSPSIKDLDLPDIVRKAIEQREIPKATKQAIQRASKDLSTRLSHATAGRKDRGAPPNPKVSAALEPVVKFWSRLVAAMKRQQKKELSASVELKASALEEKHRRGVCMAMEAQDALGHLARQTAEQVEKL